MAGGIIQFDLSGLAGSRKNPYCDWIGIGGHSQRIPCVIHSHGRVGSPTEKRRVPTKIPAAVETDQRG
ncbi:hypothetical protein J2S14_001349 [Lederbergia wuyishanensis]|uniref:Uncharacterized protein n=1 Tax=Lederbergia wuyishanensis TaxID=1347903 RepID=A0ABU0D2C5_9BACI|nr:hypothetical protein [Lederbergia wuyishanensis]